MDNRENFATRLGFILVSAGCAIGVGNVWRFPYITGKYGGAAFVLIYLFFLIVMGLPVMTMEFAVGRASQKSIGTSFKVLEKKGTFWHLHGIGGFVGCYLLMMFYTTVAGWFLAYALKMAKGDFISLNSNAIEGAFSTMLSKPLPQIFWMLVSIAIGFVVCYKGLQNGVERVTKIMMICLLGLMLVLSIRSVTLPGAIEGIKFYLIPNFNNVVEQGVFNVVYAAMGQAFFTLSLGIGAMAIFGSYISKTKALLPESITITILDTVVALMAGFIIFPACFAYGVNPGSGPGLVFVTLPNIFAAMPGGRFWGTLFFLFLSMAALTTIIAVFENIIAICMDALGWDRKKAVLVNAIILPILSLPCVFGFNIWSGFMPFGEGSGIMDLEDFLISNNILPLGSLIYVAFCTTKIGWGFENFLKEADEGEGLKFPRCCYYYCKYVLPLLVLFIFVMGYKDKFFAG